MISNSKELLINIKKVPDKESVEYDSFWENEAHKVEYGVTIDGVFIHGWLYWHCNLWNIYIDTEDKINKIVKRTKSKPYFRDNEWIIAEALKEAEDNRQGLMLFGSRRLGKSEFLASYITRNATIFQGSENAITGGNWVDIDIITGKVVLGMNDLPEYFQFGRISENLRKEIEFGFKDKKNKRISWSKILIRNFDDGIKTEAAAGITAKSFVIDEVGKFPFAACFEAARPAFTSEFGWRCTPILTGTSGDIKKSSDAEKFFLNPEAHNFIYRDLPEEGNKRVGVFISGLRRMEGKYETTIGDYVKTEKGILVPKDSVLNQIPFKNSDLKKAEQVIDKERELASKSPDASALTKAIMYYPKNTKELFLHESDNNFPIEALQEYLEYLTRNEDLQGKPARLYRDVNGKVNISYNTIKKPIIDFPLKPEDATKKDAPVVIYEPPMENAPAYLYVSGGDPYNQSSSLWSSSLGSIYIYKRIYDPIEGTFQRRIVASYTARPNTMKEFYETCEMLFELYNCKCLPENEASNFIQYFDSKNKGYMLADGYNFLQEIHPKTTILNRPKGLPATKPVQRFYKELVYQYVTEEIVVGVDKETGEFIKKLGLVRIPDIGLIKELINYDSEGNFDRYVAFGHTLMHEVWANKMYPLATFDAAPKKEEKKEPEPPKIRSPFGSLGSSNPFGITRKNKGSNPFGLGKG